MGGSRGRISATIITLEAEGTLERTLESLEWVDEIVVVDAGSTDATERIARAHGAHFHVRDWPGYGVQKQRAVEAASGEWIFSVDADEVVTPALAASARDAVSDPGDRVGFRMIRHTLFLGTWLGSRGWWRERKLRLFRRDRGRVEPARVHEGIRVDGPVGDVEGVLLHRPWRSVAHRLEKYNRYSTLEAQIDFEKGRRCGGLGPLLWAAGWFLKIYVKRGGFLHGRAGLLDAGMIAAYAFQRGAKLNELWRRAEASSPPRGGEMQGAARTLPGSQRGDAT